MEHAVAAHALRKRFGALLAVDGISFAIERGECFGFLGPNGAGKTTTMRMIVRSSPVDEGELTVLGMDAASGRHDRAIKRRIGVVPQEDNLDQYLSVRENLEVFARFYGLRGAQARRRVDELVAFADLAERTDSRVETLSGGMKRRLLIARSLLGDPDLLVLDEPTTGLDPRARQRVWDKLGLLVGQDKTLVLTTHYMEEAERLCDRVAIMDRGRIVAVGPPADLIAEHCSPLVVDVRLRNGAPDAIVGAALEVPSCRVERLGERVLLYCHDGEATLAAVRRVAPDAPALVRRAGLEDVFLRLTGHTLA